MALQELVQVQSEGVALGSTNVYTGFSRSVHPYLSDPTSQGLVINSVLMQTLINSAVSANKDVVLARGDTVELATSVIVPGSTTDPNNFTNTFRVLFNGATVRPLVDNLVCFIIERSSTHFVEPSFINPDNFTGCTAVKVGSRFNQVAGDPSNVWYDVSKFQLVRPTANKIHRLLWVKPPASVGGTMVSGVMQGGRTCWTYYGVLDNPRCSFVDEMILLDTCVTNDNQCTRWEIHNPQHFIGTCTFNILNADCLRVFGGAIEYVPHQDGVHAADVATIRIPAKGDPLSVYYNSDIQFYGTVTEGCYRNLWLGAGFYTQTVLDNCVFINGKDRDVYDTRQLVNHYAGQLLLNPSANSTQVPSYSIRGRTGVTSEFLQSNSYRTTIASSDNTLVVPSFIGTFEQEVRFKTAGDGAYANTRFALSSSGDELRLRNSKGGGFVFVQADDTGATVALGGGRNAVYAHRDNGIDLGKPSFRWGTVYAATGSISTSDERLKEPVPVPHDKAGRERLAALSIRQCIYRFKFTDAIGMKGADSARVHFGVGAQTVVRILQEHDLNPDEYGFLCYDEWGAEYSDTTDTTSAPVEVLSAGNRYGIRYSELCMFLFMYT